MITQELWRDYLFLTNEIEKFLMRKEFDMVNELLTQREKLQETIENAPADDYATSAEGQKIMQNIAAKNRGMTQILHMLRNKMQKNHTVAKAYDHLGMSNTGFRMDSRS